MEYSFAAERKLVFIVSTGGRNLLVEFSERNQNGASVFSTRDEKVAQAIRRTSLSRRGIITETTRPQQPEPKVKSNISSAVKSPTPSQKQTADHDKTPDVRFYDNFTQAREAITREFGLKKSDVRNPTTLARVAQEHGFTITYSNNQE